MYFQRLRDTREDRDLTQQQIADMLGIQQTVYSRYERGYQTIPLEHLIKLADFYQTSTDYLLGRTPVMTPYPQKSPKPKREIRP
jgi:transcriptional regulator with XRE-family HTH domain